MLLYKSFISLRITFYDINDAFRIVDLPGYGYAKVSKSKRSEWGPMIENYLKLG